MDRLVRESEVSAEVLRDLLEQALIDGWVSDKGTLLVYESGTDLMIGVDDDRRMLAFVVFVQVPDAVPMAKRVAFANEMNDRFVLVRCTASEDYGFTVGHQMYYRVGLCAGNFVYTVKRFASIAGDVSRLVAERFGTVEEEPPADDPPDAGRAIDDLPF